MTNPFFRNADFIKANGPKFLQDLGFENVGFEGLDADLIYGGKAWFQANNRTDKELLYTLKVRRQGDSLKLEYERILNPQVKTSVRVTTS